MLTTFGWVMFGMAVWGCCILMTSLQRRFAPEMDKHMGMDDPSSGMSDLGLGLGKRKADQKDQEIEELKKRIEILEAIVTDRKYQWEQEYRSNA